MRLRLVSGFVIAAVSALIGAALVLLPSASAEEGGVYVQFGLPSNEGVERDRNIPSILRVKTGTPVVFWNRSGWSHQVAIYDKDLAKNGSPVGTTLLDITVPPGGTTIDDPVGRLALGPNSESLGCAGPNFCAPLTKGGLDFTYTFTSPGTYLVICNIRPHFVNYAHHSFVIVE
jgi:plastocyanin